MTVASDEVVIAVEHPDQLEVHGLIDDLDRHLLTLYRPQDCHHLTITELARPDVVFLVARSGGAAVGCGALRRLDAVTGEVKRMYTVPSVRGTGVGRRILRALEAEARRVGCDTLVLETGPMQPEALALYRAEGFAVRDAYKDYPADGISIFMEKSLAVGDAKP